MNMCIVVGKNPCLQHLVRGNGDAWNHVSRPESGLCNLCKVIYRVAVQHQLANLDGWDLSVWPDLCDIKMVAFRIENSEHEKGLYISSRAFWIDTQGQISYTSTLKKRLFMLSILHKCFIFHLIIKGLLCLIRVHLSQSLVLSFS